MNHVTDINEAGRDASVLTDAGSGGLIGRAVLADVPLVDHLAADERPRYVLRNKKHGVTVEGPDGAEEYAPDRSHSGAAVVTDVRVLFAVGRGDGDRTLSVELPDIVDVRTEDGLLGGAFVVETVEDERYRFPCRGDLEPVREYLDAAVGVWTRAERQVEQAGEKVERLHEAFEAGNADVVLAAVGDVEETLADARQAADALDGARSAVEAQAAEIRADLAAVERRAHAEAAEQARERAHVRWDDGEYEAAFDDLDEADEAYGAALAVDADDPADDLLEGRRETLADERDRLAGAPVERAAHAADVAGAAEDPGAAVEWWETAVERYETALSLDWGRDDRRFGGDPDELRETLADAARELVSAYCDLARKHLADGDAERERAPDEAAVPDELAAAALAEARDVATERAPDALAEVERLEAKLETRREDLSDVDDAVGAEVDGGHSATARPDSTTTPDPDGPSPPDGPDAADPETLDVSDASRPETPDTSGEQVSSDDSNPDLGADTDSEVDVDSEVDRDSTGGADGSTDSGEAAPADGHTGAEPPDSQTEAATATHTESEADTQGGETTESPPEVADTQTVIGDPTAGGRDADGGGSEAAGADAERDGTGTGSSVEGEPAESRSEPGDDHSKASDHVTDPTTVPPESLPSLVARVFESAGWSTAVFGASTARQYDLLAGTDGPVDVTVCVWTVHPETVERVDVPAVERFAAYFRRADEADVGAVCTAAPISEAARTRAEEAGLEVLDADDLAALLTDLEIPPAEL